jgi:hypothetical protein
VHHHFGKDIAALIQAFPGLAPEIRAAILALAKIRS